VNEIMKIAITDVQPRRSPFVPAEFCCLERIFLQIRGFRKSRQDRTCTDHRNLQIAKACFLLDGVVFSTVPRPIRNMRTRIAWIRTFWIIHEALRCLYAYLTLNGLKPWSLDYIFILRQF